MSGDDKKLRKQNLRIVDIMDCIWQRDAEHNPVGYFCHHLYNRSFTPLITLYLDFSNLLTFFILSLSPSFCHLLAVARAKDYELQQTSSNGKAKRLNPFCLPSANNLGMINKNRQKMRVIIMKEQLKFL